MTQTTATLNDLEQATKDYGYICEIIGRRTIQNEQGIGYVGVPTSQLEPIAAQRLARVLRCAQFLQLAEVQTQELTT